MKKIIDCHAHMFSAGIARDMGMDLQNPMLQKMAAHSVADHTKAWLEAMDKNGIEKTVFMGTVNLSKDFTDFINSSERFVGFAKMNPILPDAVETLQKEFSAGMKGVKLYATNGEFDVSSKDAYPFYQYCQANNIPILIHFGVTIGPTSNLMTGNPLLISKVLKDFPKLNIIIAHFGAGFFREVLMLKYKQDNLHVDTSGTNNWLTHQDNFLTLKDIFKKTIEVFGAKHILYGSDTRIFPDGYREHILKQQTDILDELNLSQQDKEDIMYNNAKRVFNI